MQIDFSFLFSWLDKRHCFVTVDMMHGRQRQRSSRSHRSQFGHAACCLKRLVHVLHVSVAYDELVAIPRVLVLCTRVCHLDEHLERER